MRNIRQKTCLLFFLFILCFNSILAEDKIIIRVGHFPNITHAQGLIGHGLTRQGKGWFEERLGPNVEVQWFVYNAGPSTMEAIFADSIDLSYVGPSPTINAYLRTKGEEIRIICGACSGGASLVVQPDDRIKKNADFKGKKIGTPQLGNTQDVAARTWLKSNGFRVTLTGGDVFVIPTQNADQLLLFQKKDLDAVWTVEPWVSRIVLEANGKIYFDESFLWPETKGQYVTTHLVSSKKFLTEQPDLTKKWISAHVELTQWINEHPEEAKKLLNQEIKEEMTKALSPAVLERAWSNLDLTYDPIRVSLFTYAQEAHEIGFLKKLSNLSGIYELKLLNEVLTEKNLPEVK
jgi:NitT/TauT family transport system substrate-binding protein